MTTTGPQDAERYSGNTTDAAAEFQPMVAELDGNRVRLDLILHIPEGYQFVASYVVFDANDRTVRPRDGLTPVFGLRKKPASSPVPVATT